MSEPEVEYRIFRFHNLCSFNKNPTASEARGEWGWESEADGDYLG